MKTKACKFVCFYVAAVVGTTSLGDGKFVVGSVVDSTVPSEDLSDPRLTRIPRGAIGSSSAVRVHRKDSNADEDNPYYTRRRNSLGRSMNDVRQEDLSVRFLEEPPEGSCVGGLCNLFTPTLSVPTLSTPYLPAFLLMTFTAYRLTPPIYEAKSEFTMDMRRSLGVTGVNGIGTDMDSYGSTYEEIFNTRQSDWRSDAIFSRILDIYRSNYPNSQVTTKELMAMLNGAELKLVPHSRLITIAVRSKSPELAAALANAYVQAIESFTDEENKKRCDKAVAQVHAQVVSQKAVDDELAKKLLDFRTKYKIDSLEAQRAVLNQSLSTATAIVLEYEKRIMEAQEWVDVLEAAQKDPESFGELPTSVPQFSDIAAAYTKRLNAKAEFDKVKTWASREHPKLIALESNYKVVDKEFQDTIKRTYKTAKTELAVYERLLEKFRQKSNGLKKSIDDIGLTIVKVDAILKQLNQEKKVSSEIYQALLQKENALRIIAEQNNEIVRVGRPAQVPSRPVNCWFR